MIRIRTTQRSPVGFRFFIIPFPLLFGVALAPGELIAYAEPPIGLTPSDEKSLSSPSMITLPTHTMSATPTQTPSRCISDIGGFQNCTITTSIQDPLLRKAIL